MEETLFRRFGWKNFSLVDGAGLSRHIRLSPQQLTKLLQAFRDWKYLLPEIEPGMNENVPYHLRNRIAQELKSIDEPKI